MLAARSRTVAAGLWFCAAAGMALATIAMARTSPSYLGSYLAVGSFLALLAGLFGAWTKLVGGHALFVAFWVGLIWTIAAALTFLSPDEPWPIVQIGLISVGLVASIASGFASFVRP